MLASGGSKFLSFRVYDYCKKRASRGVYAVKGGKDTGKPLVGAHSNRNSYRARLYTLCTDSGKETVYARLRIAEPGLGYMHLPRWVDQEYVDDRATLFL